MKVKRNNDRTPVIVQHHIIIAGRNGHHFNKKNSTGGRQERGANTAPSDTDSNETSSTGVITSDIVVMSGKICVRCSARVCAASAMSNDAKIHGGALSASKKAVHFTRQYPSANQPSVVAVRAGSLRNCVPEGSDVGRF